MHDAPALFRLLGDELRLRLLRVLHAERLNVTELTSILGIAQSGVSRHLGLLKDAGLVTEQREGAHGGPDTHTRQLVPGRSWPAWARALGHLLPPLKVADLGCGEGYLTIEASRWASRVLAVDRSTTVLKRAQALAGRRRVRNITWKRGELEHMPIRDESVDVALLSQALHHAGDPQRALTEAARIVVPGGRVLVLDLREHDEKWVRDRLGDRWLGFADAHLAALLDGAGLTDITVGVGARRTGDAFTVLVASGRKPAVGEALPAQHSKSARKARTSANPDHSRTTH